MSRVFTILHKTWRVQKLQQNFAVYKFQEQIAAATRLNSTIHGAEKNLNNESSIQNKSKLSPKITLIAQNQTPSVTSLEEAQKLARRRDLHLIQIQELDTKTNRPVYKLVSSSELLKDDVENKTTFKTKEKSDQKTIQKSLTIGSRIAEHDLSSRLKNLTKWLNKNYEVRILIQSNAGEMANCEKIVKSFEQTIKEPNVIGRIVQKQIKGSSIKFNIVPVASNASPS